MRLAICINFFYNNFIGFVQGIYDAICDYINRE